MSPARLLPLVVLAAALLTSACDKTPRSGAPPPSAVAHTNRQVFQVKGVVISLKPAQSQVEIKHEEVPGYMPAMTMPFDVKDTNEMAGLEPGDPVSFRMIVTDTEGWIEQLRKVAPPAGNPPPSAGGFRLVRDVEPLNIGDPLPEYRFTNQFGQEISTAQFKGQALAITFLFTRCPFPNFCPLMANHFAEAQQKLLAAQAGPTNWHLLTISFDPDFDKPAVLKSYAEFHNYNPSHWTFASGALIDVTAIGEQVGLAFWHDETGSISHNLRTVVINSSGRVQRIFEGNAWTSDELVREMVKAARP